MVRALIGWALNNPLVVVLMALGVAAFGVFAFFNVNVEAYPDPAPPLVEVIALFPGGSAEEVERQVTIPLEVTLAGMPGLHSVRSKSLFGLSDVRCQFDYGHPYEKARQEVINRLQFTQPLPPGVTPQLSPESPIGEIYRYTLNCPKDSAGRDLYTLNDLKALQDWVLERQFRQIPRIVDVTSFGGTVKRYEIHPDPDRMKQLGITLAQVQAALNNANANVGGDYVIQGDVALNVRGVGLFGGGFDPVWQVVGMEDPARAALPALGAATVGLLGSAPGPGPLLAASVLIPGRADLAVAEELERAEREGRPDLAYLREQQRVRLATAASAKLREEEDRRIREIRKLVLTSVNNRDILLEDVVEGGRVSEGQPPGRQGVVVGHQTRLGQVAQGKPARAVTATGIYRLTDAAGNRLWEDDDEKVSCIVLLRKGDDSLPALKDVEKKVEELNDPASGKMLPGVRIEPYYDRTELIHITTETVQENLFLGIGLVVVILLMFLSNVRSAIIVAINIPIALLFAFAVLYLRGKSANLLSIGAVDFGIIVDSSVIMMECVYRYLASGESPMLPLKERILRATREIDRALLFSTAIMVCAFIPLFTMSGPEGQLFAPMAQTYAFALGGALLLAVTLAPALCLLLFRTFKPVPENFLVRFLKQRYLWQVERCLRYRWLTVVVMGAIMVATVCLVPFLGHEFMPQLEEGNLWIRGTFPLNIALERSSTDARQARDIMSTYPEVETVVNQIGRPDDGTDTDGFYNHEFFVPLRPQKDWPAVVPQKGWRGALFGAKRPRTKDELIDEMSAELTRKIPGVSWNFSQNIRDNVMESLSGIKGDNSVKIFGPDLDKLEQLAAKVKSTLQTIPGIEDVGVFNIKGQTNLEFRVDLDKCKRWGVSAADVNNVVQTALAGKAFSTMIEGEKMFDVTVRWPQWRRGSETSILDIPVDISNNQVILSTGPGVNPSPTGTGVAPPPKVGSQVDTRNPIENTPRLRLRDLVSPVGKDGRPDPRGSFERAGASTIYREQSQRLIAIKFSVRGGRDLGSAVDEAREKTRDICQSPYRTVWSGEFEEMQDAEGRLMLIVPLSLGLIFTLLYMAFHSFLDAVVVLSNVMALSVGGIWALWLTGTHFSISAAVGFVSLFGVAIMDGLLMISYFNHLRAAGRPLHEAIMQGAEKRVRPVMMTALTALLGLLPAALSTKIGAQTQRPLAIVVVGGMITTLILTRYLMPVLYSFYGHREPRRDAGGLAH
jgi:cobalt-zinc-cadmium resistance protein CzcA